MDVVTRHYPYATTCNVIGVIKGVDTTSSIVLGAHLDHLGNNGLMFPGALDNASGVALQLAVAKLWLLVESNRRRISCSLFSGRRKEVLKEQFII